MRLVRSQRLSRWGLNRLLLPLDAWLLLWGALPAMGQAREDQNPSGANDSTCQVSAVLAAAPRGENAKTHRIPDRFSFAAANYAGFDSGSDVWASNVVPAKLRLSLSPIYEVPSPNVFSIDPLRLTAVSALGLAGIVYLEHYQQDAWWHGHTTQFRFVNDPNFSGNFDKLGHTFGSYLQSSAMMHAVEWSGADPLTAAYVGFAVAFAQQLYLETNDGVTRFWGFSPGDIFSNMAGSLYPLAQVTFPELRHFTPKFSYYPSTQYKKVHWAQSYIDDYEGLTYWLSVDVHHYLPAPLKSYWPDWLNIAVGTGLRNYVEQVSWQHTVYISLDINTQKLPGNGLFLNGLKTLLNYVHLPLPALMMSPKVVGMAWKF